MQVVAHIMRAPVVHFLVLGGLLYAAQQGWAAYQQRHLPRPQDELVMRAAQIEQIKQDILAQTGLRPTPEQVQMAIATAIDEEILYRQAVALHLDRTNPSVRQRLIQLAKFVTAEPHASDMTLYQHALDLGLARSDLVVRRQMIGTMRLIIQKVPTPKEPARVTEEELQDYVQQYPEPFQTPWSIALTHVYFSRDRRGASGEQEARRVLQELSAQGIQPTEATSLGDPFLPGQTFASTSPAALERFFGPMFVRQLPQLGVGRWVGPVPSSYGWHLVWITGLRPPELPPLAAVANQVRSAILQEREERRLQATLQELRAHYVIRVESYEDHISPIVTRDAHE